MMQRPVASVPIITRRISASPTMGSWEIPQHVRPAIENVIQNDLLEEESTHLPLQN